MTIRQASVSHYSTKQRLSPYLLISISHLEPFSLMISGDDHFNEEIKAGLRIFEIFEKFIFKNF
jgi:hypothetical protein